MKYIIFLMLLVINIEADGQLIFQQAGDSLRKFHLGVSTYFDAFAGHDLYGAGIIITKDGGAAGFGDGDNGMELIKLDKTGKVQWRKGIKKQFAEVEPQCVAQDSFGNFYLFMLNYNSDAYRGGSERLVCFSSKGVLLWDKMLGPYTLENNPIVSYVHTLSDGRLEIRGHIVTEKPVSGKDPVYRFWQAWCNSKGVVNSKISDVIDWNNPEWQNRIKPE